MSKRPTTGQCVLWALLYGVLVVQSYHYASGASFYGAYLQWTGQLSAHLLLVTLALTPMRLVFGQSAWLRWLLSRRRDLGVAVFIYAAAHTVVFLLEQGSFKRILEDSLEPEIFIGWIALLVFLLLAVTSNDYSVRRLGRRWKALHKTVFAGAILTFLHWVFTAFDPTLAYLHLAIAMALLFLRALLRKKRSA